MSLLGLIARDGETVTIYRATDTVAADKSSTRSWAPIATNVKVQLEDAGAETVRKLFGSETTGTLQGRASLGVDLQPDDGIDVTAGAHAGHRYVVGPVRTHAYGASPHRECALTETAEAFA